MNVNFNGYGENVLTFIADSSLTEPGGFVKMTADGTVGKCSAGDIFVNDAGKVSVNTTGREVLVVDSTATEVGFIF